MKPCVTLRNVSKIYAVRRVNPRPLLSARLPKAMGSGADSTGTKAALRSISLQVQPGERLGIVGPNGAGKSTLLRIVAGLAAPSSGDVEVDGQVTTILSIGLGLKEDLTGRENIYVDGEVRGMSRQHIEGLIEEIIDFADIGNNIDYPLRTYSTGMKARLAFAMLIHLEPEILLIDEALSVGDAFFSAKARKKMREICERGKIAMIVSHSMQSVIDLCTRCIWVEYGEIVMDGDPVVVTSAYRESVQKRDEAALAKTIWDSGAPRSVRHGCQIVRFDIRTSEGLTRSSPLLAGQDADWLVGLQVDVPLHSPTVRLRIVRSDGFVVVDSCQDPIDREQQHVLGSIRYRIAMRPVVLGPGLYRCTIELLELGQVVAARSTVFEVSSPEALTGGRPALVYPCSVSAEVCSHAGCR